MNVHSFFLIIFYRKNYQQPIPVLRLNKTNILKNVHRVDRLINNIIITIIQTRESAIQIQLSIVIFLVVIQIHSLSQHVSEVDHRLLIYQ